MIRPTALALSFLVALASPAAWPAAPDGAALDQGSDIAYRRALSPAATARKLNADATLAARTRRIAHRVVSAAPSIEPSARRFAWAVNVVADPVPAVVVYPGGRMIVNDGLLRQTSLADDEVAAIVAHMVAHSLLGHDAKRVAEAAGAAGQAADPNRRALAYADAVASTLPLVRYSAEEVEAADRASLELLARSSYDPRAAASAWRRLRGTSGVVERVPVTDARLAALDAAIRGALPLYEDARAKSAAQAPLSGPPGAGAQRSIPR